MFLNVLNNNNGLPLIEKQKSVKQLFFSGWALSKRLNGKNRYTNSTCDESIKAVCASVKVSFLFCPHIGINKIIMLFYLFNQTNV